MFIAHVSQTKPQAPLGATRGSLFHIIYPIKHINRKDHRNIYLCVCICHNMQPLHVSLLTELMICLVVPASINISPLTGLESLKLIREGETLFSPLKRGLGGFFNGVHEVSP
jgi:hypothetical protein